MELKYMLLMVAFVVMASSIVAFPTDEKEDQDPTKVPEDAPKPAEQAGKDDASAKVEEEKEGTVDKPVEEAKTSEVEKAEKRSILGGLFSASESSPGSSIEEVKENILKQVQDATSNLDSKAKTNALHQIISALELMDGGY